jgi:hypothetical protein
MPALDICHDQVVHALEKAGWSVEPKPFTISIPPRRRVFIDLLARRSSQLVTIIEIKCFPDGNSDLNELYSALGQYLLYRNLLEQRKIDQPLYLAVPQKAYDGVIAETAIPLIQELRVKMIVIDLENEVIVQWIE